MNKKTLLYKLIILFYIGITGIYAQNKPNIVVIMADDIGLGDIGFYHKERNGKKPLVATPNIDKLIDNGMRFSDAHSPASLCAPTRFSMMTGNYSYRNTGNEWGIWQPATNTGIEPKFTTVARIAKKGGYNTAFIGKWGFGGLWDGWPKTKTEFEKVEKGPAHYGFDFSLILPQGIQNKPYIFYENGKWLKLHKNSTLKKIPIEQIGYDISQKKQREGTGDSNWDPTEAGPILANTAVEYIKKQSKTTTPFYLYYCSQAVHVPHTPSKKLNRTKIAGSTLGNHGDMIKELDAQVGLMVKALKKSGQYKNTLFVFTSDNGGLNHDKALKDAGHDSSNGLKGKKAAIDEGGHRVPFVAVWPGKIAPKTESDITIVGHDMVATISTIANVTLDKEKIFDSANLLPVLLHNSKKPIHKFLMHQAMSNNGSSYALRKGNWKLILKGKNKNSLENLEAIGLYNLKKDVSETENLISKLNHKEKIKKMKIKYLELRNSNTPTVL